MPQVDKEEIDTDLKYYIRFIKEDGEAERVTLSVFNENRVKIPAGATIVSIDFGGFKDLLK